MFLKVKLSVLIFEIALNKMSFVLQEAAGDGHETMQETHEEKFLHFRLIPKVNKQKCAPFLVWSAWMVRTLSDLFAAAAAVVKLLLNSKSNGK